MQPADHEQIAQLSPGSIGVVLAVRCHHEVRDALDTRGVGRLHLSNELSAARDEIVAIHVGRQVIVADRITNPNGSYTVGGDCRGSASLQKTPFGTANWEFVIVGDGSEVLQIATTPARGALLCVLKKQFSR